ncbi:MAG: hypothetical protein HYY58_01510 [Candidatus Omnitrophica bacterium]|nr:hypothetical protein [Candidatus Omnitrophota bacterium]
MELLRPVSLVGAAGASAFCLAFLLTPLVRRIAVRVGWIVRPAEDRWGRRATARSGGIAMFLGFLGALLVWVSLESVSVWLLGGAALVFALGLLDDLRRLPPYTKLIAQLLVGCLMVIGGIRIELAQWTWVSIPLSVLWFVLIMNAFNLLDNMDGLAAGIGAIASGFCMLHAMLVGQGTVAVVAAMLLGVCVGFLWYNFPPAKIYMGDSGSHFLGLMLAALALLLGSPPHSTSLLSVLAVPSLVLAVPLFDTCFVTLQRLAHRQHPFLGGTDHVSHRLAILGLSVRQTVCALYGLSLLLGVVSLLSAQVKPFQAAVLWLLIGAVLVVVGRYLARVNVYRVGPKPAQAAVEDTARRATVIDTMLLHKRRLLEILVDFALLSSTYVVAWLLRFEGTLPPFLQQLILTSLPIILVVKLSCFAGCGVYRGVWRYWGLSDAVTVFKAVTLGSVLSSLVLLFLWRFEGYSRAVLIIDWALSFLAVGGSRVLERVLDEWIGTVTERGEPVIILGAGDTGERVLRYLKYDSKSTRRVVGFLDDDARTHGNHIHGCVVLGGRGRLVELLKRHHIREVLIAISDPPGVLLEYVRACCEPSGVAWKVVSAGLVNTL